MFRSLSPNEQLLKYLKFQVIQIISQIESDQDSFLISKHERLTFIKHQLNSSNLSIMEIFPIEYELISLYPEHLINSLLLETKEKYIKALPGEALDRLKSLEENEHCENNKIHPKEIIKMIYNQLHAYYYFINERESFIHKMKSTFIALLFLLMFISIFFIFSCVNFEFTLKYSLFFGMACGGCLGAIISTVQRLQQMAETPVDRTDREATLLKIYQGKRGIYLSIILGTIAPFIIYFLMRFIPESNNISVLGISLLPDLSKQSCNDHLSASDISTLYPSYQAFCSQDYAKIIFISFLSGFSERLVPDVLDRISNGFDDKFKPKKP